MNYRNAGLLLLIAFGLMVSLSIFFPPAEAFVIRYNGVDYNVDPVSSVSEAISPSPTTENDTVLYSYHPPYRITQGQTVYPNDTIDISGMGWGVGVAWYGTYGEYEDPQYIRMYTGFRKDVREFYLDPSIFAERDGMWYQYYTEQSYNERRGNLEAFFVKGGYRTSTLTYPNGTIVNETFGDTNETIEHIPEPLNTIIPEVRVADFLVAHGDTLDTNFTTIWAFGRVDGIYNSTGNVSKETIFGLEEGSYKVAGHSPGKNTIFEVGFDKNLNAFTSPWKGVDNESVLGSQPRLDFDKFLWLIKKTDDEIVIRDLEVQEPSIVIKSIDDVDVGNRSPVAYEDGLTLMDVRGYTNVAPGTELSFVMDPDLQTVRTLRANTFNTTALRTAPGNMSYYQIYIPINKNNMPDGIHTLLASTAIGGSMRHDFPIFSLPADSFVPNATIKYMGDSNPWKPNMTIPDPIVVTVTKEIVKEIVKEVPPSNETVYEQQLIAQSKINEENMLLYSRIISVIIGLIFFALIFWYGISVYRRM